MTSSPCGVDALLRAAQYIQFLEESGHQQQLYQSIVSENPPISTGMFFSPFFFPYLLHIHFSSLLLNSTKNSFIKPHTKSRAPKKKRR